MPTMTVGSPMAGSSSVSLTDSIEVSLTDKESGVYGRSLHILTAEDMLKPLAGLKLFNEQLNLSGGKGGF